MHTSLFYLHCALSQEYTSVDGRPYWYNKETKRSVWECPDEVVLLKQEVIRIGVNSNNIIDFDVVI